MIPKVLNFIWIGSEVLPRIQERVDKFAELNPNCEVKIWNDENIKEFGIDEQLENSFNHTMRADLVRFQIIAKYGGAYIDCDMVPISCMEHLFEYDHLVCCNEEQPSPHSNGFMSTGFFMAPPNDPIVVQAAEDVLKCNLKSNNLPFECGPWFFRRIINKVGTEWTMLPTVTMYPVGNGSLFKQPIDSTNYPDSVMAHYWGSIGRDLQQRKITEEQNEK